MTPAQRAAANLDYITYLEGDDAGNRAKRARVIEAAYAEREAAVARLIFACNDIEQRFPDGEMWDDLREALAALAALEGK